MSIKNVWFNYILPNLYSPFIFKVSWVLLGFDVIQKSGLPKTLGASVGDN